MPLQPVENLVQDIPDYLQSQKPEGMVAASAGRRVNPKWLCSNQLGNSCRINRGNLNHVGGGPLF